MPINQPTDDTLAGLPTREELQAELLAVPDLPPQPEPPVSPGFDDILSEALRYVRDRRGADLLAVILVGSGARRSLTAHSDVNLIALVKGQDEGEEIIRVADRFIDIRYRSHKAVEQEMPHALRLASILRKGRVLMEHESAGGKVVEKAAQRFRQGPPPAGMNEKIHLKAECLHRLGKADDMQAQPPTAHYLLNLFVDDLLLAFFRLNGYWCTAPADMLRFVMTRDPGVGELLERLLSAPALEERLTVARQATVLVFKDVPSPARVD